MSNLNQGRPSKVIALTSDLLAIKDAPLHPLRPTLKHKQDLPRLEPKQRIAMTIRMSKNRHLHWCLALPACSGALQVGETVEVHGGDRPRWHHGRVEEENHQKKYFEYESEVILPMISVTRIPPGPLHERRHKDRLQNASASSSRPDLLQRCHNRPPRPMGSLVKFP
jgi:hypothetical protein